MAKSELPAQQLLNEILRYDDSTGKLYWRVRTPSLFSTVNGRPAEHSAKIWNTKNAHNEAFVAICRKGYRVGAVFHTVHYAHRVIWRMVFGTDLDQIDHIDGDKTNNLLTNLRSVDGEANHRNTKRPCNNTSGVIGVNLHKPSGRWRANIVNDGKAVHLGYFGSLASAALARKAAEERFGYHPNHGRG